MSLCGRAPLLAGIAGDADHSDLAVRPRLLRDPFDQIVMVRILVAVMAFGLRRSSRLCNDVDIAIGNESSGIARLDRSEPQRRVGRLRRQDVGNVRPLDILVVQRGRV